jgi:L,D-transpeptidase YbiS
VFDTPRGEFAVNSKLVDPDWIKPDWAFIEEGESPPKKFDDRVDSAMLGDYALGFGNGYFIHGTLYTRLLGRNVTHGCVRVGDKDLEAVYKSVPVGSKIFIF